MTPPLFLSPPLGPEAYPVQRLRFAWVWHVWHAPSSGASSAQASGMPESPSGTESGTPCIGTVHSDKVALHLPTNSRARDHFHLLLLGSPATRAVNMAQLATTEK